MLDPAEATTMSPATDAQRFPHSATSTDLAARTQAAADCGRLNGQCDQHFVDLDGSILHQSPQKAAADPTGATTRVRLVQWHNETPYVEVDESEFDVATLASLIGTLSKALADLAAALTAEVTA
jgi:hypothetical protein